MLTVTQQEFKWKVGDKVLHEYEEKTITDMTKGRVFGLVSEFFRSYGNFNDEIFPLTEEGKLIADFFHEQEQLLHKLPGSRMLNWPSLACVIRERFNTVMRCHHAGDMLGVVEQTLLATTFFRTIHGHIAVVAAVTVEGFSLFNAMR
jgi:hypothetical protein